MRPVLTVAQILGVGSMSMLTVAAAYGLGITMALLSDKERESALMYGWINQFIALFAIGVGKLAIVSFLTRVQGYQTRLRAIALWTLAASNLLVNIITAILIIVQCSPVERLWDAQVPGQCPGRTRIQIFGFFQGKSAPETCTHNVDGSNSISAYSAFVDFALALYPILIFSRVQAFSIPTRIGLCVLMGCGLA